VKERVVAEDDEEALKVSTVAVGNGITVQYLGHKPNTVDK
jgi:hypothetical protein